MTNCLALSGWYWLQVWVSWNPELRILFIVSWRSAAHSCVALLDECYQVMHCYDDLACKKGYRRCVGWNSFLFCIVSSLSSAKTIADCLAEQGMLQLQFCLVLLWAWFRLHWGIWADSADLLCIHSSFVIVLPARDSCWFTMHDFVIS